MTARACALALILAASVAHAAPAPDDQGLSDALADVQALIDSGAESCADLQARVTDLVVRLDRMRRHGANDDTLAAAVDHFRRASLAWNDQIEAAAALETDRDVGTMRIDRAAYDKAKAERDAELTAAREALLRGRHVSGQVVGR